MTDRATVPFGPSVVSIGLVTLTLASGLAGASPRAPTALRDTLRIGLLLSSSTDTDRGMVASIERGVRLGAEEASRTAALFGGLVVEVVARRDAAGSDVMIAAVDERRCDVSAVPAHAQRLVLVIGACRDNTAARHACGRLTFFLSPSNGRLARARAYLTRGGAPAHAPATTIALWHPTLQRFGAAQLNERFRRRFGAEMDPEAWTGWIALKILTEAALRSRSTRADDLARYLRSRARFDGHKGEALSFDPSTGELRQPLYVVELAAGSEGRVTRELSIDAAFGTPSPDRRCEPT